MGEITTKFFKGIFDIKAEEYIAEGVPFVRISNLKDGVIDENGIVFITSERNNIEKKTSLKKYDLILSKTAYPAASLVQIEECNTSQDTIAVRTKCSEDFNAYLAVYLNTRFGLLQMERLFQGNIQMHLSLSDSRTITIPVPNEEFQAEIRQLFEDSILKRQESKALYAEAEALLLRELGLDSLDLSPQIAHTANYSEAMEARRLDAEYFQPKYQRTMEIMGRSGNRIKDVAKVSKRRFKPESGDAFEYIEIGDLGADGHIESKTVMGGEAPSRAQWIVRANDVITSTVRPIRRLSALIEPEHDGNVCSSGFLVLKPKRNIEPELLLVYLRLPIVCEIFDLYTTASMYPAISVNDLMNIPISLPEGDTKDKIVYKVQKAFKARSDAKILLDEAKNRVEEMILGEE